ncbi:MAG: hypothetical protein R2744_13375 [Bacteroidales bacterium]
MVSNPAIQANQDLLLQTLAGMGDERVMPYLEARLNSDQWYHPHRCTQGDVGA